MRCAVASFNEHRLERPCSELIALLLPICCGISGLRNTAAPTTCPPDAERIFSLAFVIMTDYRCTTVNSIIFANGPTAAGLEAPERPSFRLRVEGSPTHAFLVESRTGG
jgi:hypothetical protein